MPTIKDIAKRAGVSHGTVSNVLNNKGNVSVKKIKLVQEVAKELGFNLNTNAKSLRKGTSNTVAVILPNFNDIHFLQIYNGIKKVTAQHGFTLLSFSTNDVKENEVDILEEVSTEMCQAIFTVSCLKDSKPYYDKLQRITKNIIFIERKPENALFYFGFNYTQASTEITNSIIGLSKESISVMIDHEHYSHERKLVSTLRSQMYLQNENIFFSNKKSEHEIAYKIINNEQCKVIITSDYSKANTVVKALYHANKTSQIKVISLMPSENFYVDKIIPYYLNYYNLGIESASFFFGKLLHDATLANTKLNKTIENIGFVKTSNSNKYNQVSKNTKRLKILTVKTPTSKAITRLLPMFEKDHALHVSIDECSFIEFDQKYSNNLDDYDVIRMDVAQFPKESEYAYLPLKGLDERLDHIIDGLDKVHYGKFMSVNDTTYTLPLDPSVQVLFYRHDIFNDQIVKRTFYEKYKQELTYPTNWKTYEQINEFFANHTFDHFGIQYGSALNNNNLAIIATDFFTIYYALGGQIQFSNAMASIDQSIGVKAIEIYKIVYQHAKITHDLWWDSIVESYANGETAMLLGYMNHLSVLAHEDIIALTSFENVPNNTPLLGGGVIGINKTSKHIKEATDFLIWLHNLDIAHEITMLGGITPSTILNKTQKINETYPWLFHMEKQLKRGIRQNVNEHNQSVDLKVIESVVGSYLQNSKCEDPVYLCTCINEELERLSEIILP